MDGDTFFDQSQQDRVRHVFVVESDDVEAPREGEYGHLISIVAHGRGGERGG